MPGEKTSSEGKESESGGNFAKSKIAFRGIGSVVREKQQTRR